MKVAARFGQLETLQWLHERYHPYCRRSLQDSEIAGCCAALMDSAAIGGHFYILQWLLQNCGDGCTRVAAYSAARHGNLEMVRWIHENFADQFDSAAMDKAAGNGHLAVVKWLHEFRSEGCTRHAMDRAAINGHLEVVQWLHNNRKEGCTTNAMDFAAYKGRLEIIQWLHDNRSEGSTKDAMSNAAHNGHFAVVRWLHTNRSEGCNATAMETAAWNGHFNVARWLGENTLQRAATWGIHTASTHGYLEGWLVIFERRYGIGAKMGCWEQLTMRKCFRILLDQLDKSGFTFSTATQDDNVTPGLLKSLARYHNDGYLVCVSAMLRLALQRGYILLAEQFFEGRSETEHEKYVEVAAENWEMELVRWLLESGARLNLATATKVVRLSSYVEIVGWLPEADRVALVQTALKKNWKGVLQWILANTKFVEESARE